MIAERFRTVAAVALVALFGASCAHHAPNSNSTSGRSASAEGMASTVSGAAAMGRGRCEALQGAEREKCLAEDRR